MNRDWLLLDVLGQQPVVVAQGDALRKFVPLANYLRRNSNLGAIREAVGQTVRSKTGITLNLLGGKAIIRTDAITMDDGGPVHGVQVWIGPPNATSARRTLPGAVKWNLTTATASSTTQALLNSGLDVSVEKHDDRPFAADLPIGDINQAESLVLAQSLSCKPGDTFCSTWDVTSFDEKPIRVSFVARAALERQPDGTDHLIARAMNWRAPRSDAPVSADDLAQRILRGMEQDGVHRALVELKGWNLLKWIDPPCPHIDWRREHTDQPLVHPGDRPVLRAMTQQFADGPTDGLFRISAHGGGWVLIHATVYRVTLMDGQYVGLICLRLPTPAEIVRKRTAQ